jgi:hypothetical protein
MINGFKGVLAPLKGLYSSSFSRHSVMIFVISYTDSPPKNRVYISFAIGISLPKTLQ